MNPRQRRGVLFLALAAIGAIIAFATVANYVSTVREDVEPKTRVLTLARDARPMEPITSDMLRTREMPEKWVSKRALRDPAAIAGRVPASPLPAGTDLQDGMLVPEPAIEAGQREISILISADTGVAGKIRPGDYVDIQGTFAGNENQAPRSRRIIPRARIVTIGTPRAATTGDGAFAAPEDGGGGAGGGQGSEVVPVTFALSPRQVLVLTYAESFAEDVRLALVRPGDRTSLKKVPKDFTLPRTAVPVPGAAG